MPWAHRICGYASLAYAENDFPENSEDTQGILREVEAGVWVLAFRGTSSWADMLTDLHVRRKLFGATGTFVHGGFLDAFNAVLDWLNRKLLPLLNGGRCKKLYITGHSLGGALATLAAAWFRWFTGITLITFGCPNVGDQAFADLLDDMLIHNYRHGMDAVTFVPHFLAPAGVGMPTAAVPTDDFKLIGTRWRWLFGCIPIWRKPPTPFDHALSHYIEALAE